MDGVGANAVLVISRGPHTCSWMYCLDGCPERRSTRYAISVYARFE